MTDDALMRSSVESAFVNSALSIVFSAATFGLNAFVLRRVSKDVLGTTNVRLGLLQSTILNFSREWLRKSCVARPADPREWKGLVNLIWLGFPLSVALAVASCYVWIAALDPPDDPALASQYPAAVALVGLSCVLELLGEPFWIVSMAFLHAKFRSAMDFAYAFLKTAFVVGVVILAPGYAVVGFAFSNVFVAVVNLLVLNLYFGRKVVVGGDKKKDDDAPFASLRDFYPDFGHPVHRDRLLLGGSFFKQGVFKQLLSEGERYMFTWFGLMTLAEQGVFDVVSAFGALAARIVFSKVEESAYIYFSQTVKRGGGGDASTTADHLRKLLRIVTLIGAVVATFGQSYSHALLRLYGGAGLSDGGVGPALLRAQSGFTLFMAVNGVTECFAFAVMTAAQVERYNFWMAAMTCVFLALSYGLCAALGPIGFVVANCANFAMRIAHSCVVITRRHRDGGENPLWGIVPGKATMATILAAGIACKASELNFYGRGDDLGGFAAHVAIGAACLAATLAQVLASERFIRDAVTSFVRSKVIGKVKV